ncbi:hypothetical protein V6N12_013278 [Hibiscus sabdariffa]|uniref:Uncharacterized protein n=1 Tax=Hibiscus sabdariffa TaxID=183260 RepID=A0ABR2D637_9ROSI
MKNANMIVDQDDEPAISNSGSVDNAGTTDAGNLDAVAFNAGDPQVVITDTDGISDAITQDAMSSPSTVSLHVFDDLAQPISKGIVNHHHMVTRSKRGIFKPKVYSAECYETPTSVVEALQHP